MRLIISDVHQAWATIYARLNQDTNFSSVRGKVYQGRVSNNEIIYSGEDRNGWENETISFEEFTEALNGIRDIQDINTSNIKDHIPNSLYRKRSPFIALLASAGIIIPSDN